MTHRYAAKRLPQHAGVAAWNEILGQRPPPQVLEDDIRSDYTVVGAGFAGLAAARRLSQLNPGAKITVLDAGRVGEAAAGRNSGFMIDLPHELTSTNYAGEEEGRDRKMIALNRLAIGFAQVAVDEYGIDPNFFDRAGKVNGAATETGHEQNISYAAHLAGLNEGYEMLDAQAMADLTGSRYYRSGLYTPGTVMLQPAGYVRGLAAGLSKYAQVFEKSPVLEFIRQGDCWLVKSREGSVSTDRIILSNNGHLESFGFKRGRLMHIFLFASMTEELDSGGLKRLGGRSRWGITPSDPMGTTMRRIDTAQGGNRIVTRTCAEFRPDMKTTESQMTRATKVMRRKFDDRFPQLAGVRMEYVWSGHLCLSRNAVSVVQELDTGVFSACVQNGLGTTRGTLTGIAAAEMANGVSSTVTEFFSQEQEPTRLPPPPISTLGATAVLRWKEWRARDE